MSEEDVEMQEEMAMEEDEENMMDDEEIPMDDPPNRLPAPPSVMKGKHVDKDMLTKHYASEVKEGGLTTVISKGKDYDQNTSSGDK
jgi:hypothetical protein